MYTEKQFEDKVGPQEVSTGKKNSEGVMVVTSESSIS